MLDYSIIDMGIAKIVTGDMTIFETQHATLGAPFKDPKSANGAVRIIGALYSVLSLHLSPT